MVMGMVMKTVPNEDLPIAVLPSQPKRGEGGGGCAYMYVSV